MKKRVETWTIAEIVRKSLQIDFPEYQREPNVWPPLSRSRLIDSLIRGFDISSIILFKRDAENYDCIDGRQRLTTIFTFFGIVHHQQGEWADGLRFKFRAENELNPGAQSNGDCSEFMVGADEQPMLFGDEVESSCIERVRRQIRDQDVSVVVVDEVDDDQELNLMFARLQLSKPLNSGEKLHAMTGWMRDKVFNDIGTMDFFQLLNVPYRRFAKQQVAAQALLQATSIQQNGDFARARFVDLQRFFGAYEGQNEQVDAVVKKSRELLSILGIAAAEAGLRIGNRATAVSYFSYFFKREIYDHSAAVDFAEFLKDLSATIKWQTNRGDVSQVWDNEYGKLIEFRTNLTQAAVEPYAIRARDEILHEFFQHYRSSGEILGDGDWAANHGSNPSVERQNYR